MNQNIIVLGTECELFFVWILMHSGNWQVFLISKSFTLKSYYSYNYLGIH